MMFHEIAPKTLTENVFSLIGDRWMLITAGTPDHCNTMTASWGGLPPALYVWIYRAV